MLSIAQLTHVYPNGTRALDNVSLDIPHGMFGLLGPNGAGKSSLMRCVATLQIPSAGAIRFGELDVLAEPARLRAQLGYLPQDFGVYPRVSAYDMLDHLAVLKGVAGSASTSSSATCRRISACTRACRRTTCWTIWPCSKAWPAAASGATRWTRC
jgi:ABC-type multidrug transport system ATPase subunit